MIKPNFKLTVKPRGVNSAEIVIEPLPVNFGHTVGNALRRVLLSSLSGGAAIRVKIAGVTHQFSTLDGLQEDILQFILNLKQVRFALAGEEEATVTLSVSGEKVITAADLSLPSGVRIANCEQVLAHLTAAKSKLSATITVGRGTGYVPAEEHATSEAGVIPLDASFSPVVRANYSVEATRVGRRTDLEKVRLMVTTNGTVEPEAAVLESAKILATFYTQVFNPTFEEVEEGMVSSLKAGSDQSIEDLDLPTRITNALKKGGLKTLADLVSSSKEDLIKVKNLGAKSAELVIKKAKAKGINLA
ncbi:DNA-directed RNA polymerase subunit alpha [Candidatus Collierbacteria bacterium RIFCSPLOWO2_01_FULL_50_23]|uniref:DNA-directed RNA polymerase subunit alpha n=1 Tax=Candidatus Collierbacteria bacterium RIFCSPHIGHO2_01_FULL_50_25 TaxID=1817722 RepID=A0A1F5EXP0_9BACT|nr:MAG: DNA-directed RNA polymerase subunit alpha [Candidatus Collierbacteria bacterium RIFCSPHIGHO2_01_FULL_50_25]OGD74959.1 MAG: DNA-directed RNA polymerase subunit alpha [Candidatus Collierbacteria bacterium RIFCSPLOWO2_01_FULL_50_23]